MTTSRRSSTRWLRLAAGIAAAALIGAGVLGVLTYQDLQHRLDALPRTAVPGEVSFEVPGPQGVTVFYEDPVATGSFVVWSDQSSTITSAPVDLTVTGPGGPHELDRYERDLRFDVHDRVATAVATFDAPTAGTYTLHVTGDVPAGAMVAVGDVVDAGLLLGLAGSVALFVLAVAGLAATIVVALVRGTSPSTADPAPDRDVLDAVPRGD